MIVYGDDQLLWNETIHPWKRKFDIVIVVAHEISHQWFGNLVTAKWWNIVWINEGYAQLFGFLSADLVIWSKIRGSVAELIIFSFSRSIRIGMYFICL